MMARQIEKFRYVPLGGWEGGGYLQGIGGSIEDDEDCEYVRWSDVAPMLAEESRMLTNLASAPCCPRLTRCDDGIWRCGILVS
jgi:hypothetical protein